jgi:hypothetical protein
MVYFLKIRKNNEKTKRFRNARFDNLAAHGRVWRQIRCCQAHGSGTSTSGKPIDSVTSGMWNLECSDLCNHSCWISHPLLPLIPTNSCMASSAYTVACRRPPPCRHFSLCRWQLLPDVPPMSVMCSTADYQRHAPLHRPPTSRKKEERKKYRFFSKKNVDQNVLEKFWIHHFL